MKIEQFLITELEKNKQNNNVLILKQKIYPLSFSSTQLYSIVSILQNQPLFFDNSIFYRILSFQEVLNCEHDLGIDIKQTGIIPIIDCSDNDFISYSLKDNMWCKYNCVEEIVFNKKNSILDYFI